MSFTEGYAGIRENMLRRYRLIEAVKNGKNSEYKASLNSVNLDDAVTAFVNTLEVFPIVRVDLPKIDENKPYGKIFVEKGKEKEASDKVEITINGRKVDGRYTYLTTCTAVVFDYVYYPTANYPKTFIDITVTNNDGNKTVINCEDVYRNSITTKISHRLSGKTDKRNYKRSVYVDHYQNDISMLLLMTRVVDTDELLKIFAENVSKSDFTTIEFRNYQKELKNETDLIKMLNVMRDGWIDTDKHDDLKILAECFVNSLNSLSVPVEYPGEYKKPEKIIEMAVNLSTVYELITTLAAWDSTWSAFLFKIHKSDLGNNINRMHYTELCLAWLQSADPNYTLTPPNIFSNSPPYRVLSSNCPVDVEIFDKDDRLVAAIISDEPQIINGISIISEVNEDGEKRVILPSKGEYTAKLTATDDGQMSFALYERCYEASAYTRILNYNDIAIKKGDVFIGRIPAFSEADIENGTRNGSSVTYSLTAPDSIEIVPSLELRGDSAMDPYYLVTLIPNNIQFGTVKGQGYRLVGGFAAINAIPNDGYEFVGWYSDDKELSKEASYRLRVDKNISLTARFAPTGGTKPVDPSSPPSTGNSGQGSQPSGGGGGSSLTNISDNGSPLDSGSSVTETTKPAITAFTDVSGHWAEQAIKFVVERGLFNGVSVSEFAPDLSMTRAMFATVLSRLAKGKAVGTASFTDVPASKWYYDGVIWAAENGIVKGVGGGVFDPDAPITREQMAEMLYNYAAFMGEDLNGGAGTQAAIFVDSENISDWARTAVSWANAKGIITGKPGNIIDPQGQATRAEVSTVLMRWIA
jgi:hypothetical protein